MGGIGHGRCWVVWGGAAARVVVAAPDWGGLCVGRWTVLGALYFSCRQCLLIGSLPSTPLGMANLFMVATDAHLLLLAIGTAILASLVPYTLEFLALRRLPPSTFGILLSMEPAVAATAGWLLLNQHMGVLGMLAVCLVVSACVGTATSKS